MKIIRHTAPDMRQALRAIREQLGEDAVILSTKRTSGGVEVTAAVDFDAASLQQMTAAVPLAQAPAPLAQAPALLAQASALAPAPQMLSVAPQAPAAQFAATPMALANPQVPGPQAIAPTPRFADPAYGPSAMTASAHALAPSPFEHIARELRATSSPAPASAPAVRMTPAAAPAPVVGLTPTAAPTPVVGLTPAAAPTPVPALAASPAPVPAAANDSMSTELKTLRRMLETQLAQLAWNDMTRRAPVHTEILRELTEIGIAQDLADHLIKQLADDVDLTYARRFAISGLSQYLLVTGDRWLENGGRVALIGATGVGKTTTLAKLAVRWVLRHGPRDLALVSCDSVRIGAQDQMQSLGQLLGAPVYTPENFESLPTLVSRLERYRLILIDTPGSSLRDAQLSSRLAVLANSASHLETALVLGANTQAGALEEAVKRFAPANPSCCLLTKLDEAASLGGALSVLIRSRLPISYMSEGQRVPEDLRPARALELVSTAVRLAKATGAAADEDLLRRRFGKIAHALT